MSSFSNSLASANTHDRKERRFLVTLFDERDGPACDDPAFTAEVMAVNEEVARQRALRALREIYPGQLNKPWAWCIGPRYFEER